LRDQVMCSLLTAHQGVAIEISQTGWWLAWMHARAINEIEFHPLTWHLPLIGLLALKSHPILVRTQGLHQQNLCYLYKCVRSWPQPAKHMHHISWFTIVYSLQSMRFLFYNLDLFIYPHFKKFCTWLLLSHKTS
jgi:hypothetical protein